MVVQIVILKKMYMAVFGSILLVGYIVAAIVVVVVAAAAAAAAAVSFTSLAGKTVSEMIYRPYCVDRDVKLYLSLSLVKTRIINQSINQSTQNL